MSRHEYNDLTIEIFDDPTYKFGSADNKFNYTKHYFGDGGQEYPTSKHGIKILNQGDEINSCIIIASGGSTGVFENSYLIDNDKILICCCDTLFCLNLPDLELLWQTKTDLATCFEVYKLQDDYLTYGEIQVSRVDQDGKIKWQFGGTDIFVSIDGHEPFKLENDHIMLIDFCNTQYKIDFNGKVLRTTCENKQKTAGNTR